MKSTMSYGAKSELLDRVAPLYREANLSQKSLILDEFIASTSYARKYAIRLLTQLQADPSPTTLTRISRPHPPVYDPAVKEALITAWGTGRIETVQKRGLGSKREQIFTNCKRHQTSRVYSDRKFAL